MTKEFIIKLINRVNDIFNTEEEYQNKIKYHPNYIKGYINYEYEWLIERALNELQPGQWEISNNQHHSDNKYDFYNKLTGEQFELKVAFRAKTTVNKKTGHQNYELKWENTKTKIDPNKKFYCLLINPEIIDNKIYTRKLFYGLTSFSDWKNIGNYAYRLRIKRAEQLFTQLI